MANEEKSSRSPAALVVATAAITLAIGITAAAIGGYLTRGERDTSPQPPVEVAAEPPAQPPAPVAAPAPASGSDALNVVLVPIAPDQPVAPAEPVEPALVYTSYPPEADRDWAPRGEHHRRHHEDDDDDEDEGDDDGDD